MESSAVVSCVKAALEEAFQELVYVDRIPEEIQRPSFAVELQKTELQDMNLLLVRKTAAILITCYVETDASGGSREELNRRQDSVMNLFARGWLAVEDRHPAALAIRGQGSTDSCQVTLSVTWNDDRPDCTDPEKDTPMMEHYEVSGEIPAGRAAGQSRRGE